MGWRARSGVRSRTWPSRRVGAEIPERRREALDELLRAEEPEQAIIFCRTKIGAARLATPGSRGPLGGLVFDSSIARPAAEQPRTPGAQVTA